MNYSAKYFTAESEESCLIAAEEYFGKPRGRLACRVVDKREVGNDTSIVCLLALFSDGHKPDCDNLDASFALYFEESGVYLEIYENTGQGAALSRERISEYVVRKQLSGLKTLELSSLLKKGWGRIAIAPRQEETLLNEDAIISLLNKEMEAMLKLAPADPGGEALTREKVMHSLSAAGITYGIDENVVDSALAERDYSKKYLVASGKPAARGENGRLEIHFDTYKDGRPKMDETKGTVDYRTLDLFESVTAGQLLATRVPATAGLPGITVTGREIKPVAGTEAKMPKGKNIIISEDEREITAGISGMVEYRHGVIIVSSTYIVKGNVDMSVGNIDFDGSVVISGNVIPGARITASGNISVEGVVEAAELTAGGNIVLKRGIQGMNKGKLSAKGNITAGYIERAIVKAGGVITSNIISHSVVEAGDAVHLNGKHGSLVGGSLRALNEFSAKTIGSAAEAATEIEMGAAPDTRSLLAQCQVDLNNCKAEQEKLQTILGFLKDIPDADTTKAERRDAILKSYKNNLQLLEEYSGKIEQYSLEVENATKGRIHVYDRVFPGVKISIANVSYRITEETSHCTFKLSKGEIVFGSYEG